LQVLAFFTNSGVPATGLSPTVRIRDISNNNLLVTDAAASEIGDGWYKYDFTAYDSREEYAIRFDGGATLENTDRYTSGTNDSFMDDIVNGVWDETLAGHDSTSSTGFILQQISFCNRVMIDVAHGFSGTTYPIGTHNTPVNNLTDALTICANNNIDRLLIHDDLTIESIHNVDSMSIETMGIMGTTLTLGAGCSANKTVFRYLNLEGIISNSDQLLVEDCSIGNLENFTGVMNNVIFGQGSEITIGIWAEIIQGTAGGDPTNEVEIYIGTASLNMSGWTGNLKLKDKTGTNRTIVNSASGNIIIASTCIAGKIQLLGVGFLEKDDSGPGCTVDTEGFISRVTIAESVWDEDLANHLNDESTGHALMHQAYKQRIFIDTVNGSSGAIYPFGIRQHPVNNLADALTLSTNYGLNVIHILGTLTINGGEDISGLTFCSDRSIGNSAVVTSAITNNTYFENLTVNGTMDGTVRYTTSVLGTINNFDGGAKNSLLTGNLNITGTGSNYLTDCDTYVTDTSFKQIDLGSNKLNIIRCRGNFEIINYTGTDFITIDLAAGMINVAVSCVSGFITVSGLVRLLDNSAAGCTVIDGTLSEAGTADEVWDSELANHTIPGTYGYELATKADLDASVNTDSTSAINGVVVYGTQIGGTYNSTHVRDGSYWTIEEDAVTGITTELTFNIPTDNKASMFRVFGRYEGTPGGTHYIDLWVYNYIASAWEQLKEEFMPGGITSDGEYEYEYFERNIDRNNNNEVKFRLIHNVTTYNASHNMYLDFVEVTSIEVTASLTAEEIADAVLDEQVTDHLTVGSLGYVINEINNDLKRVLGLMHENIFIDEPVYDEGNNLVSARVRIYSDSISIGTSNNVIGTYEITADTNDEPGKFNNWSQVKI